MGTWATLRLLCHDRVSHVPGDAVHVRLDMVESFYPCGGTPHASVTMASGDRYDVFESPDEVMRLVLKAGGREVR